MTREEQKQLKAEKERQFLESIKDKPLTMEEKSKFRETTPWINFRHDCYIDHIETKVLKSGEVRQKEIVANDPLTLRPLNKNYQLHHCDLDNKNYTNLERSHFLALNPQSHDVLHWVYSEQCKDPKFLERLISAVNLMGELNDWKDVKDYKKEM